MALKIKLARPRGDIPCRRLCCAWRWWTIAVCALVVFAVGGFYYFKYQGIVDARLKEPLFADTAKIYAAPREVRPGQKLTVHLIANELRRPATRPMARRRHRRWARTAKACRSITVRPGPQSFHAAGPGDHSRGNGAVESISDEHGQPLSSYELEPLLITGLERGRQPHQAPAADLRRDSAEPGAGGGGH